MASIVSAGVSSPLGVGAVFTVPGHKAPVITSDLIAAMRMPSTPGERFSIDLSPVLPVSVQGHFYFSALADPSGGNLRYSCISTAGDASRLRTIYGCLADIQASVQASADPNDHAAVRRAVEKWNAPGSDQLVRVQAGLEDIKATMKDAMDDRPTEKPGEPEKPPSGGPMPWNKGAEVAKAVEKAMDKAMEKQMELLTAMDARLGAIESKLK